MLAINNYLVIGVNPTNNETKVPVNTEITIKFSRNMDQSSLTSSNLILSRINGDIVPCTINYEPLTMVLKMIPNSSSQLGLGEENLDPGMEYKVTVVGTADGVKSITGEYMAASRTYEFTTAYRVGITEPLNPAVTVDSGFPTVTWTQPKEYDIALPLIYEVMVSTSNNSLMTPVWPSTGDINKVASTTLNVPKKLSDGTYYAYVRAVNGEETSQWVSAQFLVEAAPVVSPTPNQPSAGTMDVFSFDVLDTYPRRDDADITPEQVMIVFGSNVDSSTVTSDSVYIVKRPDKDNLSLIDFMTNYSPTKAIPATITINQALVVLTAALEEDAEYTVIVRESVKNTSGASLGIPYHWSFVSKYSQLYGSAELVRRDIGSFSDSLTDKTLYKYLKDSTDYVYQVASNASSFVASNYTDGVAPYEVHQYVRYRTSYALLLNSQLHTSGGSGSAFTTDVTLGDLKVTQEQSSAGSISISSVMGDLQDKMKLYMDMIQGHHNRGYAKPLVVVRGENVQPEPTFLTRTEFTDLGQ